VRIANSNTVHRIYNQKYFSASRIASILIGPGLVFFPIMMACHWYAVLRSRPFRVFAIICTIG
jgi:hypothetical protein